MKKRSFFNIALLLVIFAFIFTISSFVFREVFIQKNSNYITDGLSAFMGAFFAFLFIRIADFLNDLYLRKKRNNKALVKLEQICNENLCISGENQDQLDQFKEGLEGRMLFGGIIQQFSIDKTIPLDLTDIDLINESFILNTESRRLNESNKMLYNRYIKLEECFLNNQEVGKRFLETNRENLLSLITDLKNFHQNFYNKNIKLLVKVRILLKDRYLITSVTSFLSKKRLDANQIIKEEEKIKAEILENIKKSSEEIKEAKSVE